MADPLTPAVSDRICKHMNEDHADAVLLYAQAFGNRPEATQATMARIDPQGMDIQTQTGKDVEQIRVIFDHELQDSEDAHQTLIAMIRQARS